MFSKYKLDKTFLKNESSLKVDQCQRITHGSKQAWIPACSLRKQL